MIVQPPHDPTTEATLGAPSTTVVPETLTPPPQKTKHKKQAAKAEGIGPTSYEVMGAPMMDFRDEMRPPVHPDTTKFKPPIGPPEDDGIN
jgi:hypothetical protein